ncbi:hypothetical protein MNBD_GAMMA06-1960 [hydrothermal vent metagenome]|uniref:Flagellar protein FlaG n=1 Tax=hydrothermal vent metagenome TaxID=652676 RepID=A0A3B0WAY4_9ZZZZ
MIAEYKLNEIISVNTPKTAGINNVNSVQVTKSLPENGNNLPFQKEKAYVSDEKLDDAVKVINEQLQLTKSELRFSVDKDSGITVIKVINIQTDEMIRQIPADQVLGIAQKLREGANLELFNSSV